VSKPIKVLFIHHSTGGNLIKYGSLRQLLKKINPDIEFWDHGYNLYSNHILAKLLATFTFHTGLSDNKGRMTGTDYNLIISNNSPKEYAEIFSSEQNDPTLQAILQYDIIAFKNCFPTTKIESEEQLNEYKEYYKIIRDQIKKYKDKKFILFTPPPFRRELTTEEDASRAKQLIHFLNSKNFQSGTDNLFVFDFFSLLADEKGYLKKGYAKLLRTDSHPNRKANKEIAPVFAKFLTLVSQTKTAIK
jgi:hypothetical protein